MASLSDASAPARRVALPALLFALLVAVVYSDPLFSRRNFAGRDLLVYQLPIENAVHDAYGRGRLPVWISEISGGRPLMANPNTGALYPVRPILSAIPFPVAMRLFPVIHWIAAGIGALLLVRSFGASRAASSLAAATYAFSGVEVSEVFFPNNQPGTALLPWVVWAVSRRDPSPARKTAVLSFLLGLDFLAGDIFTISLALGCSILWILVAGSDGSRARGFLSLGAAAVLGGLIAAPQIFAAFLWVPETNRAILGMKLGEAFQFSIHPARLLELVVPFPFGPNWTLDLWTVWAPSVFFGRRMGFFSTLYAGAVAVIALVETWRSKSAPVRFGRILFVLSVAVTVPPSLLLKPLARVPSPLPLRYPEKFAVALSLACAILAALLFDRVRSERLRLRWPLGVGAVLTGLAAASSLFPAEAGRLVVRLVGSDPSFSEVAAEWLPPALTEGAVLWMATVVALNLLTRSSPSAPLIALVVLSLVPIVSNRRIARVVPAEAVFAPSSFARFQSRADPHGAYRALGEGLYRALSPLDVARSTSDPEGRTEGWFQYKQALVGRGTVFNVDFDAGDFARVESLRKLSRVSEYASSPAFFRNFSLRWGVRARDQEPVPGYVRIGGNGFESWDELRGSLPDIRLAPSWREVAGPSEAVEVLDALRPGEIVIETGRRTAGAGAPGSIRVIEKSPERLRLEATAREPTWLFVLRGFWSYRRITVDGRPVEAVPAQLGFSAIPIPTGTHSVDWREELPGFEASRWGPVIFLLSMLFVGARDRRRRRSLAEAATIS